MRSLNNSDQSSLEKQLIPGLEQGKVQDDPECSEVKEVIRNKGVT